LVLVADGEPMRVPNPAAGTITKTFIEGVQYKSVTSNFQMADPRSGSLAVHKSVERQDAPGKFFPVSDR